jgi:GAF domain
LLLLKDPRKRSILTIGLFFVGIIFSVIFLFTLPQDWILSGKMAKVLITLFATFILAGLAINATLKIKKEIIVYKEKSETLTKEASAEEAKTKALDLQVFAKSLSEVKSDKVFSHGLNSLCQLLNAGQGAFYIVKEEGGKQIAALTSGFALTLPEGESVSYESGEGLIGLAISTQKSTYLDQLPEGYTNAIVSGLGMAAPKYLFVSPIVKQNKVKAVLEIATFSPLTESLRTQTEEMAGLLADKIQ